MQYNEDDRAFAHSSALYNHNYGGVKVSTGAVKSDWRVGRMTRKTCNLKFKRELRFRFDGRLRPSVSPKVTVGSVSGVMTR